VPVSPRFDQTPHHALRQRPPSVGGTQTITACIRRLHLRRRGRAHIRHVRCNVKLQRVVSDDCYRFVVGCRI
ncbi:hypothetical protein, partial [Xanthomonas hortorum]|uniref:hypothetical protein n=1 Tax=Xanthomonas hortorum TaxID=56454 RepID=UPI002FE1881E